MRCLGCRKWFKDEDETISYPGTDGLLNHPYHKNCVPSYLKNHGIGEY